MCLSKSGNFPQKDWMYRMPISAAVSDKWQFFSGALSWTQTLKKSILPVPFPSPLPCSVNSEWGKASCNAHGRAGSLQCWTLRQEMGLIFLSASFKPDMKSTLFHSPSEITKVSQLQGLPLALWGCLGNSCQNKLQSKIEIICSTGWASAFNCFCTWGEKQCERTAGCC